MRIDAWPFLACCILAASYAQAQPVEITSTDPVEDATNVPLDKRIEFHLSKPTPQFGSQFAEKFFWSPEDSTQLSKFGHDFGPKGKLNVVFYTLQHTPDTDFSFVAYGVKARDGSRMESPFVLNYTTAPTRGSHTVGGSATFADEPSTVTAARRKRLERLIRRSVLHSQQYPSKAIRPAESRDDTTTPIAAEKAPAVAPTRVRARLATVQQQQSINRTVVLLLDSYTLSDKFWTIRSAAVPDASGRFTFDHVRDGAYYPIAITFASDRGEVIGSYGFYDANGDRAPDPISVNGGNVDDLQITIYPFEASSAKPRQALARDRADRETSDQRLLRIQALVGPQGSPAFPNGTAYTWRYAFYSPSQGQLTYVNVSPIEVQAITGVAPGEADQQHPIPDDPIDSDRAVEIANQYAGSDFRGAYDGAVRMYLTAGDLDLNYRPPNANAFWKIEYVAPIDTAYADTTVFVDMSTGDVLQGQKVSRAATPDQPAKFTLKLNYPNPFRTSTRITYRLQKAQHVQLTVYDALGRQVTVLEDTYAKARKHTVTWTPSVNMSSGVYFYRLQTGDNGQTGRMVLLK